MKNFEPMGRENYDKVYPGARYPAPFEEDHRRPLYLICRIPMKVAAVRAMAWEVVWESVSNDFDHTAGMWNNTGTAGNVSFAAVLVCIDEVRYSPRVGDWLFAVKVLDVDTHSVFGTGDGEVSYEVDGLGRLYAIVDRWIRTTQAGRLAEMQPEYEGAAVPAAADAIDPATQPDFGTSADPDAA